MMVFWIMTALMAALSGLLVLAGARRGADAGEAPDVSAAMELSELDRLKGRGLMDEAAWTAARAEAGRRILSAERTALPVVAGARDRFWVLGGVAASVAGALGLYVLIATPGLPDQAYERRVDEWATATETLEPIQIAAVIDRMVDEQPDNHQALTMLGAARFQAGDPIGAVSAFRRALALQPDDARSWARLGESLVRANEGVVGPDAEAAFRRALALDANQGGARYFLGDAALARGDTSAARGLWGPLMASLAPGDPRGVELTTRLSAAEARR
jgi:cytochrome c-type biogenesis protein CcmH